MDRPIRPLRAWALARDGVIKLSSLSHHRTGIRKNESGWEEIEVQICPVVPPALPDIHYWNGERLPLILDLLLNKGITTFDELVAYGFLPLPPDTLAARKGKRHG